MLGQGEQQICILKKLGPANVWLFALNRLMDKCKLNGKHGF